MIPSTMDPFVHCPGCHGVLTEMAGYLNCKPCGLAIIRADSRRRHRAEREAVFNYYGWACVCCGSTDHPSIDHIESNGKQHREDDPGAQKLYRWLVEHNFPAGFQTLHRECNSSKNNGSVCWIHRKYLGPDSNRRATSARVNVTINVNITGPVTINSAATGWEVLAA